jgi:hypothetical protein
VEYFLVTISVQDGEYEYWRHKPVEANSPDEASKLALEPDQEWVKDDYREVSCEGVQGIPKEDFDVLARYL